MLETPGLQDLLRPLVLVVTLRVHWKGPVLLFLMTRCFCYVRGSFLLSPALTFTREHVHSGSCRACRNWGWKSGSEP